jgi:hypothetical protein
VTTGKINGPTLCNDSVQNRQVRKERAEYVANITHPMNMTCPRLMDRLHDFSINTDTRHQQYSPTVNNRRVEDSDFAALDHFREPASTTANGQKLRQQVLGPQRKHCDGNPGMSVYKISDGSVATRCNNAAKNAVSGFMLQIVIQPGTTRKHAHSKTRATQMMRKNSQLNATSAGT